MLVDTSVEIAEQLLKTLEYTKIREYHEYPSKTLCESHFVEWLVTNPENGNTIFGCHCCGYREEWEPIKL